MTIKITGPIFNITIGFRPDYYQKESVSTIKVLAVIIKRPEEEQARVETKLAELKSLLYTLQYQCVSHIIVNLRQINPATLIGSGKVAELKTLAQELAVDCVVIDHDISPRVQRNLEREWGVAVIDRQEIILEIFSTRAATREATLQVELAFLEYSLPRLTRLWTHFSRQRGGTKSTRGGGETQLELDRRDVLNRISKVKGELKKIEGQRSIQRKSRLEGSLPTAAIVGYTNVGKSSLINKLCQSEVLVEDKLFATLDPKTCKYTFEQGAEILLTDTVGFVSNLPHQLVKAFNSTLEEASYSDFIIHVCDAAHPDLLNCFNTTLETLELLGCKDKPMVVFINKMDRLYDNFAVQEILMRYPQAIVGSLWQDQGLTELTAAIEETAFTSAVDENYLLPHSRHDLVAFIRSNGRLLTLDYLDQGIEVRASMPERFLAQLQPFKKSHR